MINPYDLQGRETSVERVVLAFLREEKSATNKEIRQFLSSHKVSYERMSMNKMLNRLAHKDKISIDDSKKAFRYASKIDSFEELVELFGGIYTASVDDEFFNTATRDFAKTSKKELVEEMIRKVGIYVLFTEFLGWLYPQYGKSNDEKLDIQHSWLNGAQTIPIFSSYFSEMFKLLLEEDGKEFGKIFSNYDVKKKKILELIQILKKSHVKEVSSLLEIQKSLDKKCLEFKKNMSPEKAKLSKIV